MLYEPANFNPSHPRRILENSSISKSAIVQGLRLRNCYGQFGAGPGGFKIAKFVTHLDAIGAARYGDIFSKTFLLSMNCCALINAAMGCRNATRKQYHLTRLWMTYCHSQTPFKMKNSCSLVFRKAAPRRLNLPIAIPSASRFNFLSGSRKAPISDHPPTRRKPTWNVMIKPGESDIPAFRQFLQIP